MISRKPRKYESNPIIWNRSKRNWRDRKVPFRISYFEHTHGSVAFRRLMPIGTIAMRHAFSGIRYSPHV